MKKQKNYSICKKHISIRTWIYMIVITAGVINIFCPCIVHADLFGYEIQDLYALITKEVEETNDLLNKAFTFTAISPYDIINGISEKQQGQIAIAVRDASKTVALVVATLLLMVDFFKKAINFELSSKWENVLMLLIKIIVVKQIVQNADVIIGYIYSGFNYINLKITKTSINFLPYDGKPSQYTETVDQSIWDQFKKPLWRFGLDVLTNNLDETFTYKISKESVLMFYPDATFPSKLELSSTNQFVSPEGPKFFPTFERVFLLVYFLVMKAIAYLIFVITIGRVFELCIYTLLAPLPLATLASDTSHDVAKSFIKNYIAVVLQITVIVVMFITYVAVTEYMQTGILPFKHTKLMQFVILIALGVSVTKSCSWAKKICGAA